MDSFISTIVFLLPGFLLYFWLQSFGINPVVKHSPVELTAISALLWLPVSATTLLLYNLLVHVLNTIPKVNQIWNLTDLQTGSRSILFLVVFLLLSTVVSFIMGVLWAKWGVAVQSKIINKVRSWRGVAEYSRNASVWDEVFMANEPQVVEIGKIEKVDETGMIGSINKVSRTFEPERLSLDEVQYFTDLVKTHSIPVSNIYFDIKAGIYIKIFDKDEIRNAQLKE